MSAYFRRKSQAAFVEKYRMIGESEAFLDCMASVSRAAKVNRPILIIGERGTGKELVAARLHYLSPRWQQARIVMNCAAFSPELLASELFGYEQGAFTGATRRKPGRMELANGGSLFLDELANAPMAMQEKLLRVLEYQEYERVGGTETLEVDVRLIAATNRDLPSMCREGKFKEDLLDRLSFEVITLPPLRARQEDIPLLVRHFGGRMALEMELEHAPRFSNEAIDALCSYAWPGNIRELKNVVERAVYTSRDELIEEIVFDPFASPFRPVESCAKKAVKAPQPEQTAAPPIVMKNDSEELGDLPGAIAALERRFVTRALEASRFNQRKAAELLEVSYYQLRRLMKKFDLRGGDESLDENE